MNDFGVLTDHLDKQFPDKVPPRQRRTDYREYRQTFPDVMKYSTEKEQLFRLAYPSKDPSSDIEYRDYWLDGLYSKFTDKLRDKHESIDSVPIDVLVAEAVRYEQNERLSSNSTYFNSFEKKKVKKKSRHDKSKRDASPSSDGPTPKDKSPKSPPTPKPDGPYCFKFWRNGKCPQGDKCEFPHIPRDNFKKSPSNSPASKSSTKGKEPAAEQHLNL
jgi:hypothetical protein